MVKTWRISVHLLSGLEVYEEIWEGREDKLRDRLENISSKGYLLEDIYYPVSWQKYLVVEEL